MLYAMITDSNGNEDKIQAESVEEIASQLPEDYAGPTLRVFDVAGFTRGWIRGRERWTAC